VSAKIASKLIKTFTRKYENGRTKVPFAVFGILNIYICSNLAGEIVIFKCF